MNVEEFYKEINGDYENVMSRLATEERVAKYLHKFTTTTDFDDLTKAINNNDWEKAFLAVHTLKGMALNLGFTNLASSSSNLTEELRGGLKSESSALSYFSQVSEEYKKTIEAINQLES
ncbi:MAG: Hpt domain-containing protein [Treponema sp.]|nr:Hpt domain-containing protein [Treponema sp.]